MALIPLCVPYWDEAQVLKLGAKYHPKLGFYTDQSHPEEFFEWFPLKWKVPDGKPALYPDMLPTTAWNKNVRSEVSEERWDELRRYCYQASGNRCEICGKLGQLECHESWKFNETTKVQQLIKLLALCPLCHKAKHIGRANSLGMLTEVLDHLQYVNTWTPAEMQQALNRMEANWRQMSKLIWQLDLTWLHSYRVPSNNIVNSLTDG